MHLQRSITVFAVGMGYMLTPPSTVNAQKLETDPVTVNYSGIGPVTWTPVAGIKANLAVPHITAGPRVICFDARYKCDISVQVRNISYVARSPEELLEEIREQFKYDAAPPPAGTAFRTVATPQIVEVSYVDSRANAAYRYRTMALVLKGPAIFQVVADGPDSATVAAMVNIARNTTFGAAREMMAYRFAQFVGVCSSRVPATKAANERALAASPFTDAALLSYMRQRDTTMTVEKLKEARVQQLPQFLETYDALKPTSRQTFCKDLPAIIANTARELRNR